MRLRAIKNGWAALGDGWAVHGRTKEEAIEKYHEAEVWHKVLDARVVPQQPGAGPGAGEG